MPKIRHTLEEIIRRLGEAAITLAQGQTLPSPPSRPTAVRDHADGAVDVPTRATG